jgi:hypothetical protein
MSDRSAVTGPLTRVVSITPHDTTTYQSCRAIYQGTTGDVAVLMEGDTVAVTMAGLAGGMWHPLRVTKVLDTGTTSTTVLLGY